MITPEQFKQKIHEKLRQLDTAKLIYPVATKVHADMTERLFGEGKDGTGGKIGNYSTEPMYAVKQQFKKQGAFRPSGKNSNKAKFANGNTRKSMYLAQGYKQLKQVQGYESGFVNLTYSSDLRNDFATKLAIQKDTVVCKLSRKINANKVAWLKAKYGGMLWKHTEAERDFFVNEVTKKLIGYIEN